MIGVGAVLIAAGFAGCGGSSDDESSGALSKEDFVAQANDICSGVTEDVKGLDDKFAQEYKAGDYQAASDTLAEGNDSLNSALDELAGLEPPEADQAKIDEFLSLSQSQAEISGKLVGAAADGDSATLTSEAAKIAPLEKQSDAIADDYGMTDCGSAANDA